MNDAPSRVKPCQCYETTSAVADRGVVYARELFCLALSPRLRSRSSLSLSCIHSKLRHLFQSAVASFQLCGVNVQSFHIGFEDIFVAQLGAGDRSRTRG